MTGSRHLYSRLAKGHVATATIGLIGALGWFFGGGWLLPSPATGEPENIQASEYHIKSVWLLNFARFVEWPASAFTDKTSPVVVGVVGRDPFGTQLEDALEKKLVRGRPLLVKRPASEEEMRGCHLLFIARSERRQTRGLLEKLKGASALTVGETEDFLDQGGIVKFVLKDNSIRFEINLKAAQTEGLKLHANLLKVAVSVRGKYD